MSNFTITKATREATPALIGLWGPSNSGKTLSALKIARGLVGPKGSIGLIDTENGRAKFYADECGGWDHLDLQPPFNPDRYVEAIKALEGAKKYGCIIVDSMSHSWQGEGGVLEMAGESKYGGVKKWQAPKMAYQRMVNNLLRSTTHVIFCLRAKDETKQTGSGKDMEITSNGMVPICEKNFIYEMTVSVLIGPDHKPLFKDSGRFSCSPEVPRVKIPEGIAHAIKPGEYLSEKTGEMIIEWISGGAPIDEDLIKLQGVARDVAIMGTERYQEYWKALLPRDQKSLKPIHEDLKHTAAMADKEHGEDDSGTGDNGPDPLN